MRNLATITLSFIVTEKMLLLKLIYSRKILK